MTKVKSAWISFLQNWFSPSEKFSAKLWKQETTLSETGSEAWTGPESMEALLGTSSSSGLGKTLTPSQVNPMSTTLPAMPHFYSPIMSGKSGQITETKFPKGKQPFVSLSFFDPEKVEMVQDMGFVTMIIGEQVIVELWGLPEYRGKQATVHFTETWEASRC